METAIKNEIIALLGESITEEKATEKAAEYAAIAIEEDLTENEAVAKVYEMLRKEGWI